MRAYFYSFSIKRFFIFFLTLSFTCLATASPNKLLSPSDILESKEKEKVAQGMSEKKEQLRVLLQRKDLQERLSEFGISPEEAETRIANMSNEELKVFENEINELKAGAGILELVLVVLMIIYFAQRI